jgi:hypothetical protein
VSPHNSIFPRSAFPNEVHKSLKNAKRRRGRRVSRRGRGEGLGKNKKINTIFRKNHGQDLVFLYYNDYEMVDIQNKIKSLLILTQMAPLNQQKIFRKEIFNAEINISIKIINYDLKNGKIEYELKKTKKSKFNNKIDCNMSKFI